MQTNRNKNAKLINDGVNLPHSLRSKRTVVKNNPPNKLLELKWNESKRNRMKKKADTYLVK